MEFDDGDLPPALITRLTSARAPAAVPASTRSWSTVAMRTTSTLPLSMGTWLAPAARGLRLARPSRAARSLRAARPSSQRSYRINEAAGADEACCGQGVIAPAASQVQKGYSLGGFSAAHRMAADQSGRSCFSRRRGGWGLMGDSLLMASFNFDKPGWWAAPAFPTPAPNCHNYPCIQAWLLVIGKNLRPHLRLSRWRGKSHAKAAPCLTGPGWALSF